MEGVGSNTVRGMLDRDVSDENAVFPAFVLSFGELPLREYGDFVLKLERPDALRQRVLCKFPEGTRVDWHQVKSVFIHSLYRYRRARSKLDARLFASARRSQQIAPGQASYGRNVSPKAVPTRCRHACAPLSWCRSGVENKCRHPNNCVLDTRGMHGGFALTASLLFFPVGNADIPLGQTEEGTKLLVDLNVPVVIDDGGAPTWILAIRPNQWMLHRIASSTAI